LPSYGAQILFDRYYFFLTNSFVHTQNKYTPLLPLFSLWSPSYNQTVDSVKTILSTSAGLESQSVVLAYTYGCADIFFTRLSPSTGFDLLPEDLNRILLTAVVVCLLVAVGVVRNIGKKKEVNIFNILRGP
jgi:hypothetical protein